MSDESRAYPSPQYFEDRLRIEVEKAQTTVKSLDEALAQLRVIWAVKHREAVLSFIEALTPRYTHVLPKDVQYQLAEALKDLMDTANGLRPAQRHSADQAVSRLIRNLDPALQIDVIWPWMQDTRPFRVSAVIRTIVSLDDLNPYADYLVNYFREVGQPMLNVIARAPEAAQQIDPEELQHYFDTYIENFRTGKGTPKFAQETSLNNSPDKATKYFAMLAAKVLIVGGNTIPIKLLRSVPEVFSWAVGHIGDPAHEDLLVFLIVENHESPELLWSAVRTAQRLNMRTALDRGLETARAYLNMPEPIDDEAFAAFVQGRLPDN